MILRGTTDYKVVAFDIKEKTGSLRECDIVTLSKYYYNFLNENGQLKLIKDGVVEFIGVIDKLDYNFTDGTLTLNMTEYINIIKYNSDLLGTAPSYEVTYSTQTAESILSDILSGTDFSVGYCPNQTIDVITGNRLDRIEWLKLLNNNIICGLDSNGDYTTNAVNIVSGERNTDIIVDYINMTVSLGLYGCVRKSSTSDVWKQIKLNIDDFIIDIDELQDRIYKIKRVIVNGKSGVYSSAYISTAIDVPVKVITDNSCEDASSCQKRAQDELNKILKPSSIGIKIKPSEYYNKSIVIGMQVSLSSPKEIANSYIISEISASYDSVFITLGRPKQRFLTSLYDMNDRIEKLEKW